MVVKMRDTLLADVGNDTTKVIYAFGQEDKENDVSFSSIVANVGTRPPDVPAAYNPYDGLGFVFRFEGQWWAVGDVAAARPNAKEVRGGNRYKSKEWLVLLAAAICATAENREINVMAATPLLGGKAAEETIKKLLRRDFTTKLYDPHHEGDNTGQRTVTVANVSTMRETEGALYYTLLDYDYQPNTTGYFAGLNRLVTDGHNTLHQRGLMYIDGGGWSLDYLPVIQLAPVFRRARTLRGDYGLNWVTSWLGDELQSHSVVGGMADRPSNVLKRALIPRYTSRGTPRFQLEFGDQMVDVKDEVERAIWPLNKAIANYIMDNMNGGVDTQFIILTGGAASAIHPWLAETIDIAADERGMKNHTHVLKPDVENVPPYFHNVAGMYRYLRRVQSRM